MEKTTPPARRAMTFRVVKVALFLVFLRIGGPLLEFLSAHVIMAGADLFAGETPSSAYDLMVATLTMTSSLAALIALFIVSWKVAEYAVRIVIDVAYSRR